MLIITRRVGESIMIGDEIEIQIRKIKGNQVSIGINAERAVPVHRTEIYSRIRGVDKNDILLHAANDYQV